MNGAPGPQGNIGVTGATGLAGATGATGVQGPAGIAGSNGSNGINGAAGAQGIQGNTGPTGATGLLPNGNAVGNTPYWDGMSWVVSSHNIFNAGMGIGIGTASPQQNLSVYRGMNIDQSDLNSGSINNNALTFGSESGEGIASKRTTGGNLDGLDFYTGSLNRITITRAGNVGIGTNSPQQNLSVFGAMNIDQAGLNSGTLNSNGLTFGSGSGEGIASKRTTGGNNCGLDFYTGGSNRMSISNSGNVGIGTSIPQSILDVKGDIFATGVRMGDGSSIVIDALQIFEGYMNDGDGYGRIVETFTLPSGWDYTNTFVLSGQLGDTDGGFRSLGDALYHDDFPFSTILNGNQITVMCTHEDYFQGQLYRLFVVHYH
jgi:hypothetical protein